MTTATVLTSIVQPSDSLDEVIQKQKILYRLAVQLIGIKKRCRKSERHFLHLGHIPFGDINYDDVKQKVKDALDTNMKAVHSQIRVHLDYVIISDHGSYTHTEWQPFDSKNITFDFNL
jgi:hypothetical protein